MKPYFYIIKHNISGKYYAGSKINKEANPDNLLKDTGYKTNSKIVKSLIEADGLESFSILKIKRFNTKNEALIYEFRFLQKVDAANNEKFLNLHNGGKNFVNKGGYKLKESTKLKMRKPKSQQTISKQNINKRNRGKEVYDKMVQSRKKNNILWNSEETRLKISQSNKLRWEKEAERKKHSELMKEYYKNNPVSEETIIKHKNLSKGKNNGMFGKKHSEETKAKLKKAWEKRKLLKQNEQ